MSITDPEDPRLAPYRDIRERDLVGRDGLFIAEGTVVLEVLARSKRHQPVSVLIAERRLAGVRDRLGALPAEVPIYVASDAIIAHIAGFAVHRGVLAVGRRAPEPDLGTALAALPEEALILVLIGIANHDNIGGIFRNAAAFGVDLVLLDHASCDPLYRKAIRVSVGGTLLLPFARIPPEADVLAALAKAGVTGLGLSPSGATPLHGVLRSRRAALILGAEGAGLPEDMLARCETLRIPMQGGFDSLNVATTSGIALHYLRHLAPPR
jgi:tRNA G18 (ribose-2'-O)-methylase SpoU